MTDPVEALILDLLEWVGPGPRPYDEVMEAWRTSCPRLPVWEEANERGFLAREHAAGRGTLIRVTPTGAAHLRRHRVAASGLRSPSYPAAGSRSATSFGGEPTGT